MFITDEKRQEKKYIAFGEIMLRLSPPGHDRFLQTSRFDAIYVGAEANVAVFWAMLGARAGYISRVPDNEIGHAAINSLRKYGVDTSGVLLGGERLGIFYYENGAAQRAGKVIYDRAGSAISSAAPQEFNWKKIFDGAGWYHWTGITPALSDGCRQMISDSVRTAKEMGICVSCDLNYRSKLWPRAAAQETMQHLIVDNDLILTNMEQIWDVIGIAAERGDDGLFPEEEYIRVSRKIAELYGSKQIAYTVRISESASCNTIYAYLYDVKSDTLTVSQKYKIDNIIDRLGAGDCFGAALIYAINKSYTAQETLDFAVSAECLKHTVSGDFGLITLDEVKSLMGGNASGRVIR